MTLFGQGGTISFPTVENALYWATVGYARWWLAHDSGLRHHIVVENGKLTRESLAEISLIYKVARGFPSSADTSRVDAILDVVHKSAESWPETLIDRAQFCVELADALQSKELTRSHQISAATKLMWFLRPKSWTVFDRFASIGMGIGGNASAKKRMPRFYKALAEAGFEKSELDLSYLISQSDWNSLPAARVIDTFLMRRSGFTYGLNSTGAMRAFVDALPPKSALSLHLLATEAQSKFGSSLLPLNG
jgi:hypothetical protein